MRLSSKLLVCALSVVLPAVAWAQGAAAPKKHVLVIGQTKGYAHDSVSAAMVAVYAMGEESGLWDTTIRTDTELLTKKKLDGNRKTLDHFDLIVFASTTGELDLDDQQKKDILSFVHDEGKGFVGIHAALDTLYKWPEYGEMTGGWFDQHPWGTFQAPIRNEQPANPIVAHFPAEFMKVDEIYQPMAWSRDKVNVLLSLDARKLDYLSHDQGAAPGTMNPRVHRADHDFPVAWTKRYGTGRVFYSTLGHTEEAWKDPEIRKMYFQAIKWTLGMIEVSTASHAALPAAK